MFTNVSVRPPHYLKRAAFTNVDAYLLKPSFVPKNAHSNCEILGKYSCK